MLPEAYGAHEHPEAKAEAIFTFITMTCSKKSASAVACLLGVFLLLAAAITTLSMLDAPEFIQGYEMNSAHLF